MVPNTNGLHCKRLGATKSFPKHFDSSRLSVRKTVEDEAGTEKFEQRLLMMEPPVQMQSLSMHEDSFKSTKVISDDENQNMSANMYLKLNRNQQSFETISRFRSQV